MIGTSDTTTILVEGVEGVPLTIVGMGFDGRVCYKSKDIHV
jgi:hypothetical protein